MTDHFTGVYVQGPAATEPTKIQSFRNVGEAMHMLRNERGRVNPGWRVFLMHEEWDGDKLVKLEEV